ncbi:putative TIM-barrel fold metal-dependent hydrolase [Crossiella equi]|uniref:TIM-barrel fold metal-dependent hydrolase n=1 Tax=Crossiella equi TaxID=130796 RepID=A0ABS5ALK5_9PSEU|nr:amidohydrolase family protein [Crossiella equi]MBP2477152.1 putative TIM-barrel fold metal-dependent hydrolase [Crossiella equi]
MITDGVVLLDHHCHGVVPADLDRPAFEALLTEAPAAHPGRSAFDSLLGAAVLRWCAPLLDLDPHAEPERYLERRAELGWQEASARLLRAAGAGTWLVDTGFSSVPLTPPGELARLGGGVAYEILRLEQVFEETASGVEPDALAETVEAAVRARAAGAVGLKSVVAYRHGLELPPEPPTRAKFERAAVAWTRAGGGRLADPVLLGWLVHLGLRVGAELGLPLQLHTGFGDPDLRLHRADPLLLADFLAATRHGGGTVMLLHCWPYHRNAGFLAHVYPQVRADVGLAVPYVGERAHEVLAELLELAPFGSVCYSSDGYGLPELLFLGARLWRRGLGRLVDTWLADDVLPVRTAERLVQGIAGDNAAKVYIHLRPNGATH